MSKGCFVASDQITLQQYKNPTLFNYAYVLYNVLETHGVMKHQWGSQVIIIHILSAFQLFLVFIFHFPFHSHLIFFSLSFFVSIFFIYFWTAGTISPTEPVYIFSKFVWWQTKTGKSNTPKIVLIYLLRRLCILILYFR